jgi:hypothetical protein
VPLSPYFARLHSSNVLQQNQQHLAAFQQKDKEKQNMNTAKQARTMRRHSIHRDTRAWQAQVWISFLLAAFLCGVGLAYLPGKPIEHAFMIMGYGFCLTTAFVLAKFIRDGEQQDPAKPNSNARMINIVVWIGFTLAMLLTGWGLANLEINQAYQAYLGVSWLFLINCAFTLAKTLRDKYEADNYESEMHEPALPEAGLHDFARDGRINIPAAQ